MRTVALPFAEAVSRAEAELQKEGFGVLCRIDITAKMKEKLGVDFAPYVILGACNPPLAHRALQQEMNLGLLLPCNVVVYEQDGAVRVGAVDTQKLLSIVDKPGLEEIADEVNAKLRRAVDAI